ncbi:hypothetical protein [Streptomyces sp. TRM64462]|uniref:hypothetical protein n=1 Tax=Streptomyces sp. TRM64462 TaxID=2741726 RepID=UPI001585E7F0|nr:hypothetical protein [Streptomyces sp. TRM64462]
MPARTTPTTRTAGTAGTARATGVDVRLPWWALALPVAAFAALFVLLAGPADAARATGGEPAVGRVLEQIQHTLTR